MLTKHIGEDQKHNAYCAITAKCYTANLLQVASFGLVEIKLRKNEKKQIPKGTVRIAGAGRCVNCQWELLFILQTQM